MNISFQNVFYKIATAMAVFAILVLAKTILIPLAFSLLFAFMLLPLASLFEKWKINRIIAALLSMVSIILVIGAGVLIFSTQIVRISNEFSNFQDIIINTLSDVTVFINKNIPFITEIDKNDLINQLKNWFNKSKGTLVKQTVNSTASFFTGFFATFIFTFLLLIYRKGLVEGFSSFAKPQNRAEVIQMFKSIQLVGQKYLTGMIILIVVIGVANTIGLMIIGISNPFLFGFLGSLLAIIPYIGTTTGALLPILYALVSYNSIGMAISIGILFWLVQLVTDNFLSPKIVGGHMNINALTAILSLIIGASVWGIAGMILFLPFAAMFKIICDEYEELKPIAMLIGNKNFQNNDKSKNKHFSKWINRIKEKLKNKN